MPPGDEQNMVRGLRVDILERHHVLILVDNLCRYLTIRNFAEQAIFHRHLPDKNMYSGMQHEFCQPGKTHVAYAKNLA